MTMLKMTLPDSLGDLGNGFFGDLFPSLSGALYAAATFGSDMMLEPGKDYSGHGRDLVASGGAAIAGTHFSSSPTSYFDAPFTATELIAAGTPGECSVIVITRHANAVLTMFATSYDTGAAPSDPLITMGVNSTTAQRLRVTTAGAVFNEALIDAEDHVNGWEAKGAVWTAAQLRAHRWYTGIADTVSVTAATSGTRAGAAPFRVGSHRGTVSTYSGSSDIAAIAFYNRSISEAEFEAAAAQAKMHLASYGVSL